MGLLGAKAVEHRVTANSNVLPQTWMLELPLSLYGLESNYQLDMLQLTVNTEKGLKMKISFEQIPC